MKCFIDSNIQLSKADLKKLKGFGLEVDIAPLNQLDKYLDTEYLLLHSKLNNETLKSLSKLKYIGIRAHNRDYVDINLCRDLKVEVVGLHMQHSAIAVAEHSFALIMALSKNLIVSDTNTKGGLWRKNLIANMQIRGKTLGLIGYGSIAKELEKMAISFGMKVLIGRRDTSKEDLNTLIGTSDFISLHLSSTKETENYFDKEKINTMKEGSILINTARASLLDYKSIYKALVEHKIAGIGLDVYPTEPNIPLELINHPRVISTPHIAYHTQEALNSMNLELIENCSVFFNQKD